MGHYASSCPSGAATVVAAVTSSGATLPVETKRQAAPPARLTYDAPGKQSTGAAVVKSDVSSKSAVTNGTAVISSSDDGRVWLLNKSTGRMHATYVDQGADVSFIDAGLARELNLSISPAGW